MLLFRRDALKATILVVEPGREGAAGHGKGCRDLLPIGSAAELAAELRILDLAALTGIQVGPFGDAGLVGEALAAKLSIVVVQRRRCRASIERKSRGHLPS